MRQRNLLIGAALAASLFVSTACSSSSSSSAASGNSTSTTSTSSGTSSSSAPDVADVTGKSTFEIDQENFFFSPSTIDGSAGQEVTFTVKNDGSAPHTFTIDSNANVAYEVGTAITFVNMATDSVAIAITSDTMNLAGAGTTGTRTLLQYGVATALKVSSTVWLISGTNLT